MGNWAALASSAISAMGKSGGGGAAMPSITNTVNTSTQVNPQISPNFIQQQQPTNSAVTAGTNQSPVGFPGTPMTGAIPGFDFPMPQAPATSALSMSENMWLYGGLAAIGAFILMKRKKRAG